MEIRTAHAGDQDSDEDLSWTGLGDSDLANLESSQLVVDHGLHRVHRKKLSVAQAKE
jgi:hypothetical protein